MLPYMNGVAAFEQRSGAEMWRETQEASVCRRTEKKNQASQVSGGLLWTQFLS